MLAQSSLRAVLSTKGGFLFVEQSQEEIELRLLLTGGDDGGGGDDDNSNHDDDDVVEENKDKQRGC